MGLLDDLIGNMVGSASGGNPRQDPLGELLGGLAGGSQGQSGNLCFKSRYCCCSKMAAWREYSVGSVKEACDNRPIPG
jgi:hypothetical protein